MTDKAVKIGFGFFAVTSLFFGVVSINQKIRIAGVDAQNQGNESSSGAFDEARMRVLDTDEDGIDDWSELNVHKTSPYLADSDSDGVSDALEIKQGADPTCPEGRVCGSDIIGTLEQIQQDIAREERAGEGSPQAADFSPESQAALETLEAGTIPTAEQIRSLLRDSGVPEEELSGTSDQDLIQLFQEVAEEQQTPSQ
ncbi:MAG: hypothetical protein HY473_02490 [Candidatus Sungbacteria bacterium]|uniref:Uncharacterized protein n=1 Tax=Candidatus Sungiibacteriota bacterium TaxID=2750080 RepID=A0A933DTQ7_9BACT|nr:hypothetical protein [Parcubacteria group bacterium]MBI4132929.1 hypothetical protein [Candidatus Sungbacteria bacterium]